MNWPRKRQLKLINAAQCQFCVSCQRKYRSLLNTYLPIFCCWKLGWMRRPKHGYGESCRGEKSAMRAWSPAGSCRSSNILSPCLSPCQSHYPCLSPCLPLCLSPLSMSSYKSQCKSTDPHGVLMSVPISLPISSLLAFQSRFPQCLLDLVLLVATLFACFACVGIS